MTTVHLRIITVQIQSGAFDKVIYIQSKGPKMGTLRHTFAPNQIRHCNMKLFAVSQKDSDITNHNLILEIQFKQKNKISNVLAKSKITALVNFPHQWLSTTYLLHVIV